VGKAAPTAYLADGRQLVSQAVRCRALVQGVFFVQPVESVEDVAVVNAARVAGLKCRPVTKGVFFKLLGLGYETSVRVLAVVERPEPPDVVQFARADVCILAGERIVDPRNVGVLVRTADACGVPCVAFTRDSADPYSRASVRSSTSSIFRVPLALVGDLPACLERLKARSLRIVGTSAHAEVPCWKADLTGACVIVVGTESVGLSEAVRSACDELVTIPMKGGADSFNVTVAAGVVLYERARQVAARA
jgi:tRNA G18 (ribose-2'-O)-methylase SpoU